MQTGLIMHRRYFSSPAPLALLLAMVMAAAGCSQEKADPNRTTVAGAISFNGDALPAGTISFESSEKGIATSAPIKDGSYSTDRSPTGKVAVSIDTASIQYGNPAKYVAIPSKYADSASSGLTIDVQPGVNENVNFHLKP